MSNEMEATRTADYRRYRAEGVSIRDAIARVRSEQAFRSVAIECCEEAARKRK